MPKAIEAVVNERHCQGSLESEFDGDRQRSDAGGDRGALQVQTDPRRDGVADSEEVDGSGEEHTRQTIRAGHVPCQLRLVDGQMRSDRAR